MLQKLWGFFRLKILVFLSRLFSENQSFQTASHPCFPTLVLFGTGIRQQPLGSFPEVALRSSYMLVRIMTNLFITLPPRVIETVPVFLFSAEDFLTPKHSGARVSSALAKCQLYTKPDSWGDTLPASWTICQLAFPTPCPLVCLGGRSLHFS